jgi:hypothetical protein
MRYPQLDLLLRCLTPSSLLHAGYCFFDKNEDRDNCPRVGLVATAAAAAAAALADIA